MAQSTEVRATQKVFVESVGGSTFWGPYPITQQHTIVVEGYGNTKVEAMTDLDRNIDWFVCASVGGRGGGVAVKKCLPQSGVTTEVVPKRKGLMAQLIEWATSQI